MPVIIMPPEPAFKPRTGAATEPGRPEMAVVDELAEARAVLDDVPANASAANRTAAVARATVLVGITQAHNDRARLMQERITNLLALAALNGEESELASAEAACLLLNEEPEVAVRLRRYCEELQIAAVDYHAPLTAGAVVNILAGRSPGDDGPLFN